MRNFLYKIQVFMQGRYGNDELNITLLVVALILALVSRFTYGIARLILTILELALLCIMIFRIFSRNIYKRSYENRKFLPVYTAVTGWFKLTYKRFRDGKTHRYYKCPQCKAQLRVKNIKGEHTIRCPKCGNSFKKKIR
ncbi:MAG: MJ0042-type zinc finger domain-containing protein [Ruminococcus sp.]